MYLPLLFPDQLTRDNDSLDVRCPFVDLKTLDVAVVPLDGIEIRIASPAVEQDCLIRCSDGGLGREELGSGCFEGRSPALLLGPGSAVGEQARRLDVGAHVGDHLLNHLEIADALPELAPGPGKLDTGVQAGLADTDSPGGNAEPPM